MSLGLSFSGSAKESSPVVWDDIKSPDRKDEKGLSKHLWLFCRVDSSQAMSSGFKIKVRARIRDDIIIRDRSGPQIFVFFNQGLYIPYTVVQNTTNSCWSHNS